METCQTITLPWYGSYKLECWGASGGTLNYSGGKGGYVSGILKIKETLYVYVGNSGATTSGFNGGGVSGEHGTYGMSGGGATDIRLGNGNWNSADGLRKRLLVAAGGGGANYRRGGYNMGSGGYGGGTTGGTGESKDGDGTKYYDLLYGGSQIAGGVNRSYQPTGTYEIMTGNQGKFGYAMTILPSESVANSHHTQSGGGGGWYGGAGGHHCGGGGGSSFISGMTGCNGIDSSTGAHRGASQPSIIDGVTYTFSSPVMYAGDSASRPTNPGGDDGYAKITSQ